MKKYIQRKIIDSYDSCGSNGELLSQLFNYFESFVPVRFSEAKSSIETGNIKKFKFDLHALKNSFLNVGALSVAEECQKIEDSAGQVPNAELFNLLNRLQSKYCLIEKELLSILKEKKASNPGLNY